MFSTRCTTDVTGLSATDSMVFKVCVAVVALLLAVCIASSYQTAERVNRIGLTSHSGRISGAYNVL